MEPNEDTILEEDAGDVLPSTPEETSARSGMLADGRFFLKLAKPVEVVFVDRASGKTRTEVTEVVFMREPDTGDLLVTDKVDGDVAKGIAMVAHLTGLPPKAVRKFKPSDFQALAEKSSDF